MNQKMALSTENLHIVRMVQLPVAHVEEYWQTLYMHGFLDYRLCDVGNPTWEDVKEMIHRMGEYMFALVMDDAKIKGEFMLENFTGLAAQVHFSVLPKLPPSFSVQMAAWATSEVLQFWGLKTLYGLTPETNRAARIFNLKCGFKCIGKLPNGIRDRGKIVDGLIMVKEA